MFIWTHIASGPTQGEKDHFLSHAICPDILLNLLDIYCSYAFTTVIRGDLHLDKIHPSWLIKSLFWFGTFSCGKHKQHRSGIWQRNHNPRTLRVGDCHSCWTVFSLAHLRRVLDQPWWVPASHWWSARLLMPQTLGRLIVRTCVLNSCSFLHFALCWIIGFWLCLCLIGYCCVAPVNLTTRLQDCLILCLPASWNKTFISSACCSWVPPWTLTGGDRKAGN